MGVQFIRFQYGGYVLHKVMIGDRKFSAWFAEDGRLLEAERVFPDGSTRNVPTSHVNVRDSLTRAGKPYARPVYADR